jgi:hypothetical protein
MTPRTMGLHHGIDRTHAEGWTRAGRNTGRRNAVKVFTCFHRYHRAIDSTAGLCFDRHHADVATKLKSVRNPYEQYCGA